MQAGQEAPARCYRHQRRDITKKHSQDQQRKWTLRTFCRQKKWRQSAEKGRGGVLLVLLILLADKFNISGIKVFVLFLDLDFGCCCVQ